MKHILKFSVYEQELFPDGVIKSAMTTEDGAASIEEICHIEHNYRRILYGYTDTVPEMRKQHNMLLGVLAVKEKIIDSACEAMVQDLEHLEWLIPSGELRS